jgi:hypothetical protein
VILPMCRMVRRFYQRRTVAGSDVSAIDCTTRGRGNEPAEAGQGLPHDDGQYHVHHNEDCRYYVKQMLDGLYGFLKTVHINYTQKTIEELGKAIAEVRPN